MDAYMPLPDQSGYPPTTLRDVTITDYSLLIESSYHCAADAYGRRQSFPVHGTFNL